MEAFKIGHLRRIPGINQGFKSRLDECREPAAKYRLLAEQIRFSLFTKTGFDNPGPATTNRRSVSQANLARVGGRILMNGQQARNTRAAQILVAHQMAGA